MTTRQRLFDPSFAFDHPVTVWSCVGIVVALVIASLAVGRLATRAKIGPEQHRELVARIRSWVLLVVLMLGPILLGAAWVIGATALLALACHREFARATGLFRHRAESAAVVFGILLITFANADHWYGLLVAAWPLGIGLVALVGLSADEPRGYIQRVALATFSFALFGMGLGHLGFLANDALFRPILVWLLVCVELNDIFAYVWGKLFGRRKLAPNTSPNKTLAGALGALASTTALAATMGHFVFRNTALDHPGHLICLGLLIGALGQCGDLVVSSIKRDLGIKDMAATIPGHGGLLDRFDSLLLVAPGVFHYLAYVKATGVGLDQPARILSGG